MARCNIQHIHTNTEAIVIWRDVTSDVNKVFPDKKNLTYTSHFRPGEKRKYSGLKICVIIREVSFRQKKRFRRVA